MARKRTVGSRESGPVKNHLPRLDTPLTIQQETFVREYLIDFDRVRAVKAAGYEVTTDQSAHDAAFRLLKHPKIQMVVLDHRAGVAARTGWDAAKVVSHLQVVYYAALEGGDWSACVAALKELGKHFGIYEKHNKQRYTQADHDRLKAELEQVGFDFTRVNARSGN